MESSHLGENTLFRFDNVTVRFGDFVALDSISFEVVRGEYTGLIGPNGAGKTTLLQVILRKIKPTQGNFLLQDGVRIGYVPQKYIPSSIFPVSVREVIAMGFGRFWIFSKKDEQESIDRALEYVGLPSSIQHQSFHTLSGGQKQRIIIARTLVHKPNLLLFDEPTSAIDHSTKIRIYELLARLNREHGITILFVSHEVEHVVKSCKKVLCLDRHLHAGCRPMQFTGRSHHENNEAEKFIQESIVPVQHTRKKQ